MRRVAPVALACLTIVACDVTIDDIPALSPILISPEIVPLGTSATIGVLYGGSGAWSSSDTTVATVVAGGSVFGHRVGGAYIRYAEGNFRDSVFVTVFARHCRDSAPRDTVTADTVLTLALDAASCGMSVTFGGQWLPPLPAGQPRVAFRANGRRIRLGSARSVEIEASAVGTKPTIVILNRAGTAVRWVNGTSSTVRLPATPLDSGLYRFWIATGGMFDTASVQVTLRSAPPP